MERHATAADISPLLDKAGRIEGFWVIEDLNDLTDAKCFACCACRCPLKRDGEADCVDKLD